MAEPKEIRTLVIALQAQGADIAQGVFVKIGTARQTMVITTAVTDVIVGVTRKAVAEDDFGDVVVLGQVKSLAGAATTLGGKLMTDGSGKAIDTTADADHIGGIALEVGANDVLSEVLLTGPGNQAAS